MNNKRQQVLSLIQHAHEVTILNGCCDYPMTVTYDHITGDSDNEVMYGSWADEVGCEFSIIISEAGLDTAEIKDDMIVMLDVEGDPVELKLYSQQQIIPTKTW